MTRLKTNIEIFNNFDKRNFDINMSYNQITINIDTKIENHERQVVEKNRFFARDFIYEFVD